jgi:hypothetical protein
MRRPGELKLGLVQQPLQLLGAALGQPFDVAEPLCAAAASSAASSWPAAGRE